MDKSEEMFGFRIGLSISWHGCARLFESRSCNFPKKMLIFFLFCFVIVSSSRSRAEVNKVSFEKLCPLRICLTLFQRWQGLIFGKILVPVRFLNMPRKCLGKKVCSECTNGLKAICCQKDIRVDIKSFVDGSLDFLFS